MTTQRPNARQLRPMNRDLHRDRILTWRSIRNAFCGSCGCAEEVSQENLRHEQPSSSSGEWHSRRFSIINNQIVETGAQVRMSIDSSDIPEPCCTRCIHRVFRKCIKKKMTPSSEDLFNLINTRKILINEKQTMKFCTNETITAKYTALTFLPIFLYEQFRRYSNLFFLVMASLQQIPGVSPTGRYITIVPLLFILSVSAIKELIEDRKRHQADKDNNRTPVKCFERNSNKWKTVTWKEIRVGDIVRVHDQENFPADLVLLASSNPDGMCFVRTSNIDGEANLKIRQALPETKHLIDESRLGDFHGTIECEPPNRKIYEFFGVLKVPDRPVVAFNANQFLQRGAALSSTAWVHGIVVYSGPDTKLMKSYAGAPLKASSVERLLNKQFISLFGFFLTTALVSAVMNFVWYYRNRSGHSYLGLDSEVNGKTVIFNILTFLILYNNLIPISLQVTVEMVHFFQAIFINADVHMYHPETETYAVVRSSNLNEELGMVQYVLTDKTGTLTCNVMKFQKCSIAGILYDVEEDMEKSQLIRNIRDDHPTSPVIEEFMLLIALCHSVVAEQKDDGTVVYHATNPDDQAIIEGAKACGYEFIERGSDYIDLVRLGSRERYELLQVIEFTSSRKRMSVFIRMPSGEIKLFCKGADSIILERLSMNTREYYNTTREHLNFLADKGYRTLCCAITDVNEEIFMEWVTEYRRASTAFSNREEEMERVANEIEKNLTLLGVTAIEDKLQDGVPDTINFLLAAGIRVWMLTGDKQETAINIGYSSGLLHQSMRMMILNEVDARATYETLKSYILSTDRFYNVALIIDGKTLDFAMGKRLNNLFKLICLNCRVVICCRLSPLQKGRITELVNTTGVCTLAIGDGANDVNMIRKARVGIGISGNEGHQAASVSDFSIAQFRFLKRLLFVHGAWNYNRITTLTLYCFYKNIMLSITLLWFCIYNGWSGQVLFDPWIIAGYNIMHTAWPPLAIGVFDKVCSAKILLKYPRIYSRAHNSKLFNVGIFWVWILNALFHSLVIFFMPIVLLASNDVTYPNGQSMNLTDHGNMVYTTAITTVCLKAGLILHSWNYLTHIAIWGSFVIWFLTIIAYSHMYPVFPVGAAFSYSHLKTFPSITFWLFCILIPVIALLPDIFLKVFLNRYFVPLHELANQEERSKM